MSTSKKVSYCYVTAPDRPGQGAKVLVELKKAKVNLAAYSGFPAGGGRAQLDLVTDDVAAVQRVAKQHGWRLSKPKKGILIQGKDEVGAIYKHLRKLADQRISVTAADAVAAGKGRYGMILWVKPRDYARAARTLRAR
jgi:hypothetical protein